MPHTRCNNAILRPSADTRNYGFCCNSYWRFQPSQYFFVTSPVTSLGHMAQFPWITLLSDSYVKTCSWVQKLITPLC